MLIFRKNNEEKILEFNKKILKYTILLVLIIIFIQYEFDIKIIAKLPDSTHLNKANNNSSYIDIKVSIDILDFEDIQRKNANNENKNSILIDDFSNFIQNYSNNSNKTPLCPSIPPNLGLKCCLLYFLIFM